MEKIINSKEELNKYLDSIDWDEKRDTPLSSVYFLVEFDNHQEPLYFVPFEGWYFESPCCLNQWELKDDDLEEYVKEIYEDESFDESLNFEKTMQINGVHYEIYVPQCSPFLTMPCKIIKMMSETECLDWLLKKEKESEK